MQIEIVFLSEIVQIEVPMCVCGGGGGRGGGREGLSQFLKELEEIQMSFGCEFNYQIWNNLIQLVTTHL